MYNKLFTKILDSSIWLAPDPHRLVWITLIASMDEDGNAMFACADNLAARARVTVEEAEAAIADFEAPDPKSGDPENEGRRIERFPGGWHVLNAHKYRQMVTKQIIREQTRMRTEKWRKKKAGDAPVTQSDESVTTSEAIALSKSRSDGKKNAPTALPLPESLNLEAWEEWMAYRRERKLPKYKDASIKKNAKFLAVFTKEQQQEIVDYSIRNSYQGLFEPKEAANAKRLTSYERSQQALKDWAAERGISDF
jgi:hypothetical protein